jgi:phosphate starvation-inducible protein PhoH
VRGLSLNCKAIIVDEASSLTKDELELVLSRIGKFSKVFIIGSKIQSDIKSSKAFCDFMTIFDDIESREHGIYTFEFNEKTDILRSEILQFIMSKIGAIPK